MICANWSSWLKRTVQHLFSVPCNRSASQRSWHRSRRDPSFAGERLEDRTLLATLVSATRVTYQDLDGDVVTVTLSKPFLTSANVNAVFTFNTGSMNGINTVPQRLNSIMVSGIAAAAGTNITTSVARNATTGGDGRATLGQIDATGRDLGNVTIQGDLGRILAGDGNTATQGLGTLKVHSMGRFGTATGAPNLESMVQGRLASLNVSTDIKDATIIAHGGVNGRIGAIFIGGSFLGGTADGSGTNSSEGDMGSVMISGNVISGGESNSGSIRSNGKLSSVTIGGSLIGGAGNSSGLVHSSGDMGPVKVGGNVHGAGGMDSGSIRTEGKLASVSIGGSLMGAGGASSGTVMSHGDMKTVKVGGNLTGGNGSSSGSIQSFGKLTSVFVGGSVVGGTASATGNIFSTEELTNVTINGDLVGGSLTSPEVLTNSGVVYGGRIGTMTLGGSLIAGTRTFVFSFDRNGAIISANDIGNLTIRGGIVGNPTHAALIQARGRMAPSGTTDLAIGKLTVTGRVEFGRILAGVVGSAGVNADAQIGPVVVGGNWIASDLVAGAVPGAGGMFGDGNDAKMSGVGVKDVGNVFSRIASITIGGQIIGTATAGDHYGFVAENIGSLKVNGANVPLTAGNGNDNRLLDPVFGDIRLREI